MHHNVHDGLFKWTFSQPQHAAGELRLVLPKALVERLDFSTLKLRPGSFVDAALKDRHTDLLFSVQLTGREALLYLLFEHQSKPELLMPFRLLVYLVRGWEDWLKQHPGAKRLPPIVPVVLHHSESGWTAATRFEELYDLDDEALAAVREHLPHFRFVLDDISHAPEEALKARDMSAFARLVLFCFRYAREPEEIVKGLSRWAELVREVRRAPDGAAALGVIWRYIFAIHERVQRKGLMPRLLAVVGEEERETMISVADDLIEEGLQKGLQQGHRAALLKLLRSKFGELPEHVVARVNAADPAQLDLWLERILSAPTLADLIGEA